MTQERNHKLTLGYSGVVQRWECDNYDHLNVSFHFGRSSDQAHFTRNMIGLSPQFLRDNKRGTVALEEHARFHREAASGELIRAYSAPLEIKQRTMTALHELRNSDDDLITSIRVVIGFFDTQKRKLTAWPDQTVERARAQQIDIPAYAAPKFISGARIVSDNINLETTREAGFGHTGGAAINAWECDQFGHMNTMFYVRRFNEAAPHFWEMFGLSREGLRQAGTGFVVGEMKITYISELLAGDICAVYSCLRAVTEKTVLIEHRLFDAARGTLSAIAYVRAVYFDLTTRRATAFPSWLTEQFSPHIKGQ